MNTLIRTVQHTAKFVKKGSFVKIWSIKSMDYMAESRSVNRMLTSKHWAGCSERLRLPPDVSASWWEQLKARYSEAQRHYHTLDHLEEMLGHYEAVEGHLEDKDATLLAMFFHDVIYDPKKNDNEEKSAELFNKFAQDCSLQSDVTEKVEEWIIATKHHTTDAHMKDSYGDLDLHYFLDMDMAVLGRQSDEYMKYAAQIRQEYIHIEEEKYKSARAQVLQNFLKVPNIFATQFFRERYENSARNNISDEIDRLTSIS